MKVKDIIKKQTTIIAIAVVLVAATVIGVSYAIFFDVGASDNQVITAGTLKMTISDISALDLSEPVQNEDGLKSTPVSYTVKNTDSNLPAKYQIYIYGDSTNGIDLSKVKVSLDGTTYKALTDFESPELINGTSYYPIITNKKIAAGATDSTQELRIWLDEDLMVDSEDGQKVDLSLYIVSEVDES